MNTLLLLAALTAYDATQEYDATVIVLTQCEDAGGQCLCSGVIVDPSGIVLTAEHCRCGNGAEVLIGDKKYGADSIYEPEKNNSDEASVLRIRSGGPFSYTPVAPRAPSPGDRVHTVGYPRSKRIRLEGLVKEIDHAGNVICDFLIDSGHSGGPLWNESGEVVGVASGTSMFPHQLAENPYGDVYSVWIGTNSIQTSLQMAAVEKPVLHVFGFVGCPACERFLSDYDAGKFAGYTVKRWDVVENPKAAEFDKAVRQWVANRTGRPVPAGYPAFYVENRAAMHVGYSGVDALFGWLRVVVSLPVIVFDFLFPGLAQVPDATVPDGSAPTYPEKGGDLEFGEEGVLPDATEKGDAELRQHIEELRRAIELLSGGPISKIRGGLALKSELEQIRNELQRRVELADDKAKVALDSGARILMELKKVRDGSVSLGEKVDAALNGVGEAKSLAMQAKDHYDDRGLLGLLSFVLPVGLRWYQNKKELAA